MQQEHAGDEVVLQRLAEDLLTGRRSRERVDETLQGGTVEFDDNGNMKNGGPGRGGVAEDFAGGPQAAGMAAPPAVSTASTRWRSPMPSRCGRWDWLIRARCESVGCERE